RELVVVVARRLLVVRAPELAAAGGAGALPYETEGGATRAPLVGNDRVAALEEERPARGALKGAGELLDGGDERVVHVGIVLPPAVLFVTEAGGIERAVKGDAVALEDGAHGAAVAHVHHPLPRSERGGVERPRQEVGDDIDAAEATARLEGREEPLAAGLSMHGS